MDDDEAAMMMSADADTAAVVVDAVVANGTAMDSDKVDADAAGSRDKGHHDDARSMIGRKSEPPNRPRRPEKQNQKIKNRVKHGNG